jgi:hypothetical protein
LLESAVHIYLAVFIVRGIKPGILDAIIGVPESDERLESVLVKRARPITEDSDLAEIVNEGERMFGGTQHLESVEYKPKVELQGLSYLGNH